MDPVYKAELELLDIDTQEMNPERKAMLLTALRSGKYDQAKSLLRRENIDGTFSYCCLGVACDISGLAEWERLGSAGIYQGQSGFPDQGLLEWYGFPAARLHTEAPITDSLREKFGHLSSSWYLSRRLELTELNDCYGWTFDEIADLIEYAF